MAETTTTKPKIGTYKKRVIRNVMIVCAIYGGLLLLRKVLALV